MNSPALRPRRPIRSPLSARPELRWFHDGLRFRATPGPEVEFQCESAPGEWTAVNLDEEALAATALALTGSQWRSFGEFLPAPVRALVEQFEFGRMAALQVATRCPGLLEDLAETPALTPFLVAHRSLRGGAQPGWMEINAVFEREGVYGVLQWLGLPASRQTLAILRNIADPDVPRRLLEPLRAALWDPEAIWALSHAPLLTDERLAEACHALAA